MKYQNNHAAALRGQNNYNRKQVLFLTGLTDQQLTDMQMFLLTEWLSYFYPMHSPEEWLAGHGIWRWWLYIWNDLDEQVIPILYKLTNFKVNRLAHYRQHIQLVFNVTYNPTAGAILADFKGLLSDFEAEFKKALAPSVTPLPRPHYLNRDDNTGRAAL